jgi:DUF3012 family protein
MSLTNKFISAGLVLLFSLTLSACSPEVGSDDWCGTMKEKPKGEWTANDTSSYAQHCLFN